MMSEQLILEAVEKLGTVGILAYTVIYVNKSLSDLQQSISKLSGIVEKCSK